MIGGAWADDSGAPGGAGRPACRALGPVLGRGGSVFFTLAAIIVRGVREDVAPIGLSFWRTLLGFLIVLPIFMRPVRRQAGLVLRHWRILSVLTFLLVIAGNAMLFLSLQSPW